MHLRVSSEEGIWKFQTHLPLSHDRSKVQGHNRRSTQGLHRSETPLSYCQCPAGIRQRHCGRWSAPTRRGLLIRHSYKDLSPEDIEVLLPRILRLFCYRREYFSWRSFCQDGLVEITSVSSLDLLPMLDFHTLNEGLLLSSNDSRSVAVFLSSSFSLCHEHISILIKYIY